MSGPRPEGNRGLLRPVSQPHVRKGGPAAMRPCPPRIPEYGGWAWVPSAPEVRGSAGGDPPQVAARRRRSGSQGASLRPVALGSLPHLRHCLDRRAPRTPASEGRCRFPTTRNARLAGGRGGRIQSCRWWNRGPPRAPAVSLCGPSFHRVEPDWRTRNAPIHWLPELDTGAFFDQMKPCRPCDVPTCRSVASEGKPERAPAGQVCARANSARSWI